MPGLTDVRAQRSWARVAGFMFLFVLASSIAGLVVTSSVGTGQSFAEQTAQIVASETVFRIGLVLALLGSLSTVLLAVALFVTVRPIDGNLALLGLLLRVGEAAIGGVGIALAFAELHVRAASVGGGGLATAEWQALAGAFDTSATTEVAAIFFSCGSTVFFFLLLRSRYIPHAIAGIGLLGSPLYAALWTGRLIAPDVSWLAPYASVPILIAELSAGLWLLFRAVAVPNPTAAGAPR